MAELQHLLFTCCQGGDHSKLLFSPFLPPLNGSAIYMSCCLSTIRWAREIKVGPPSDEIALGLNWILQHFQSAGPRRVEPAHSTPPILVFSDGACEEEGTSIGAVIVAPGLGAWCFGAKVSVQTLNEWRTIAGQRQLIGQAELFPLLVARLTWPHLLRSRRAIFFVDNESARIGMVRAYSPVVPSLKIILDCLTWDYSNNCSGWYARVPSPSNPGDAPSRMVRPDFCQGVIVVPPVFPTGHVPDVVLE